MAYDVFMKVDGIAGESTDDQHQGWIELLGYEHGLIQPTGQSESSSARGGERVTQENFVVLKQLDKASPKLANSCCTGSNISSIEIDLCRATGEKQLYAKYELSNVLVTSYRPQASATGNDTIPSESVGFNVGSIKLTYTETNPETGAPGGNVDFGWDFTHNKTI